MRYLNETYETQADIEELADSIIQKVSKDILKELKKGPRKIIQIPIRSLKLKRYNELSKYLDQINRDFTIAFLPLDAKPDDKKRTLGFYIPGQSIVIYFPYSDLKKIIDVNNIYVGQVEAFFYDDSIIGGKSVREVLIHEIQHALDDWRSKGKVYKTKEYSEFLQSDGKDYDTYLKLPHEISSRFSEAISRMDYIDGGDIIPLNYFLDDFKRNFNGWDKMTPDIQKRLIRRASGFWNKKDEELKNKVQEMKILSLDEYIKLNEDFYNPFDEKDDKPQTPKNIADAGGLFQPRKETFNLARVEWSKRPGGDYTVYSKTQFARGEIIEICPLIILPEIARTVDRLKDLVFEIDKKKGEYGLVLGYGSLYRHSDEPNVDYAYNKRQRHMFFIANRPIKAHEELTINYGSEYWEERSNLDLMSNPENISKTKSPEGGTPEMEESEIQPNAADIEAGKTNKVFGEPNSRANPAVSGVAIKGVGQS